MSKTLKEYRLSFIYDGQEPGSYIRKEIVESWRRSKYSGVNPAESPYVSEKQTVIDKINSAIVYRFKHMETLYSNTHELLEKTGAAILYLNNDLELFNKGGDKQLLAELKAKNIRFGTLFSEKSLGTTAISLAIEKGDLEIVKGEEHYSECLTDYITMAVPPIDNSFYSTTPIVIIAPMALYSEYVETLFKYALNQFLFISCYRHLPDVFIKNSYLNEITKEAGGIYIIINIEGYIIEANGRLYDIFNKSLAEVSGKKLSQEFPELAFAEQYLESGASKENTRIVFEHLPEHEREYLVNCVSIKKKNKKLYGMVITMHSYEKVRKKFQTITNSKAYYSFDILIGESNAFNTAKKFAIAAAKSQSTVLITGESGTGKELFAQSIHNASDRSKKPFIPLNCAAIPKELIGSELFGYTEGAFTGARKNGAPGKFELAEGGTFFLDEISEMPLDMQSVLLRVLEDHMVTRIGGSVQIALDVKIIAATNKNLLECIEAGTFRRDLYYRLNVLKIELPPLRNRREDIPLLVKHFLKQFSNNFQKEVIDIDKEVMDTFTNYSWPGNLREMRNVIERCVNIVESKTITAHDLPNELYHSHSIKHEQQTIINNTNDFISYSQYEQEQIKRLLIQYKGNKSMVAKEMGISRKTLYQKLEKLGLH